MGPQQSPGRCQVYHHEQKLRVEPRSAVSPVFGNDVAILCCGTHTSTVAVAHNWDDDMDVMDVVRSRHNSWERVAHDIELEGFFLNIREASTDDERVKEELLRRGLLA